MMQCCSYEVEHNELMVAGDPLKQIFIYHYKCILCLLYYTKMYPHIFIPLCSANR
jgi:hypothetical protein